MVEHELAELVGLKAEQRIEISRVLVLQLFDLVLYMLEGVGRNGFLAGSEIPKGCFAS